MIKGIGHTAFNVTDMEKTIAFYERTFGFKRAFSISHPETGKPWIEYLYAGGDQFIELFYGATEQPPYRDENAGFFHLCLQVEDIDAAWQRITEAGAPRNDAPKTGGDGNRQCWTHDPDGVKIELMQVGRDSLQARYIRSLRE